MVKQVKIKASASHRYKQRGGSMPEQIIISTQSLLILLLIAVIICGTFVYLATRAEKPVNIKLEMPEREKETVRERSPSTNNNLPPEPSRVYQTGPDFNTAGSVFNFPTQGYAEQFQQVGLLIAPGSSALSASDRTLVPLYGRRIAARRDKWNYYSRTDGLNPVQVPVRYKNRDCDEDIGCDEVFDGDEVAVPAQGQTFKVQLYKQKNIIYNPFA
uniref:Uncharacterized protein n=1 Tax=viral metagenome TaxID=1070528 RepID=A0A6C0BHY6_9ZZZZ